MSSPRRWLAVASLLTTLGAAACQKSAGGSAGDAAADGLGDGFPFDAPASADGIAPLSLDFTATGCATFDLGASRCTGAPPLMVTFVPIASPSVTQFLWDFGDGTPKSKDRTPTHVYPYPGSYDVALVGAGPGGSLSRTRAEFIVVPRATLGQPCDVDAQCDTQHCVCGSASGCGGAFARGLCTADCPGDACAGGGAVCADLSVGAPVPPAPVEPYRRTLCLSGCTDDSACAGGLRCRLLPAVGGGAIHAWVRACFDAVPGNVGDPCRAADGTLPGQACVSGVCAALGARGVCSAACDATGGCPSGAACARFVDGRSLCLHSCLAAAYCTGDPLIGCEAAGAPGPLGFAIITPGAPATACAPRSCQSPGECAPAGTCTDGHCIPQATTP